MGRTLPSATQIVLDELAGLRSFYDALRRSDQLILDRFFEDILQHRAAIANATNLLPIEIMPFVILLEAHKKNDRAFGQLHDQVQGLARAIEASELNK
jgi:hypothetical protein